MLSLKEDTVPRERTASEPVGLIAGWGSFPLELAEEMRLQRRPLVTVGLSGLADNRIEALSTAYRRMGLLKIGKHMRFMRSQGVTQVMLAGKIFKDKVLYGGRGWIEYFPDLTCLRILGGSFITKSRDARDDTLLSAVVREFERLGMTVLPITEIAPKLLCDVGTLTKVKPSRAATLDAEFGFSIARQMGGLDVGQSITVKDQIVLGVEAIEGTDALIDRTATLCPRGGFTLVKVAKPNQDMRFDVPTVGARTVERMVKAGGKTIVVEANCTILVERERTLELANQFGITIMAKEEPLVRVSQVPETALRVA